MRRRRRKRNFGTDPSVIKTWTPQQQIEYANAEKLEKPLAESGLNVRVVNTLEEYGIFQVKDLLEETTESLMEMDNFGAKTMGEVIDMVKGLGLNVPWSMAKALAYKKKEPEKPVAKEKK